MSMKQHAIIAADRSLLAANMYRLLFAPFGYSVVSATSLDEMSVALRRRHDADLLIVSSNVMSGRLDRLAALIREDRRMTLLPTIILHRAAEREKGRGDALAACSTVWLVERPFHPDEFVTRVQHILANGTG